MTTPEKAKGIPDFITEQGSEYIKWWKAKERYIEAHNTEDHPDHQDHTDKYLVTIEYEVEFSRENDGVLNAHDAEMWLKTGDIDWGMCDFKILKIKKKEV